MSAELHRVRNEGIAAREIDGETVVLDVPARRYYALNRTGSLLWERLREGATEEVLVQALVDGHGVDRGRAANDVRRFLAAVADVGLLGSEPVR